MNVKKTKRTAVIVSVLLALSLVLSGLTVFAENANSTKETETTETASATTLLEDTGEEEATSESSAKGAEAQAEAEETVPPEAPPQSGEVVLGESAIVETFVVTIAESDSVTLRVTYPGEDGAEVEVASGDSIKKGIKLNILAESAEGFFAVQVNETTYENLGKPSFEIAKRVESDVVISATLEAGEMVLGMSGRSLYATPIPITSARDITWLTTQIAAGGDYVVTISSGYTGSCSYDFGVPSHSWTGTAAYNGSLTGTPANWNLFFDKLAGGKVEFNQVGTNYVCPGHTQTVWPNTVVGTQGTRTAGARSLTFPTTTGADLKGAQVSVGAFTGGGASVSGMYLDSSRTGTNVGDLLTYAGHVNYGTNTPTSTITVNGGILKGTIDFNNDKDFTISGTGRNEATASKIQSVYLSAGTHAVGTLTARRLWQTGGSVGAGTTVHANQNVPLASRIGGTIIGTVNAVGDTTIEANTNITVSGNNVGTVNIAGNGTMNGGQIDAGTVNTTGGGTFTLAGGTVKGSATVSGVTKVGQINSVSTLNMNGTTATVVCPAELNAGGQIYVSAGTMHGKATSTFGTTPQIEVTNGINSAASGTFILPNATGTIKINTAKQIGRIEGQNVTIVATVNPININSFSTDITQAAVLPAGNYNEVFANGRGSGGNTFINAGSKIGTLFLGSDQRDIAITSYTIPAGWNLGSVSFGGRNFSMTGATLGVDINTNIGGAGTMAPALTEFCGFTKYGGTYNKPAHGDVFLGGYHGNSKEVTYTATTEKIAGSVYGGQIDGVGTVTKATYTINDNTAGDTVAGSVYGGNKYGSGTVTDAVITLTTGKIGGNIYGGSASGTGSITNTSDITINNGTVGSIYGGTAGGSGGVGTADIDINNGTVAGNIYGGNAGGTGTVTTAVIDITNGSITGTSGVFGGGVTGRVGTTTVNINRDILSQAGAEIYGGPAGGSVTNKATVNIKADTTHNIYGGGTNGDTKLTEVNVGTTSDVTVGATGAGNAKNIYGGGKTPGTVSTNTAVNIGNNGASKVAMYGNVYGGGTGAGATVMGTTAVSIDGSGINPLADATIIRGSVFGGGEAGAAVNSTASTVALPAISVTIGNVGTKNRVYVAGDVHGGGNASVGGGAGSMISLKVYAGVIGDIYGGGLGANGTSKNTDVVFEGVGSSAIDAFAHSVYGGGNTNATVSGNTTVTINNAIKINGTGDNHVFGGGNSAGVDGQATVKVDLGGTVATNIYGGGRSANVRASVVNMEQGFIDDKIPINALNIAGDIATAGYQTGGNIFGGGLSGNVVDTAIVNFGTTGANQPTLRHNIYGGSDLGGTVGTSTVNIDKALSTNGNAINGVYGGGNGKNTTTNTTNVNIKADVKEHVFGGGRYGTAGTTNVIVTGATVGTPDQHSIPATGVRNIYGGSYKGQVTTKANVTIQTTATINGHVYGSGRAATDISQPTVGAINEGTKETASTAVAINASSLPELVKTAGTSIDPNDLVSGNVFGGSDIPVTGTTTVTLTGATASYVFGGGSEASTGAATTTVNGGSIVQEVYGGSSGLSNGSNNAATVASTIVNIGNATAPTIARGIYGGGFADLAGPIAATRHNVAGTAAVNINLVNLNGGNVYGGGNGNAVMGKATVTITGGTYHGTAIVFGGGTDNFNPGTSTPTGETKVDISGGVTLDNVYGGGQNSHVVVQTATGGLLTNGNTEVTINGSTITKDVFGGGYNGSVDGTSDVTITSTGTRDIYGGGVNTAVTPNYVGSKVIAGTTTTVNVTGTSNNGNVYGGGKNQVTTNGGTEVTIDGNITLLAGSVYGGGIDRSPINGKTQVTVLGTLNTGSVYGGGIDNSEIRITPLTAGGGTTTGSTKVTLGGNANVAGGSVYGGGINASSVHGNTTVTTGVNTTVNKNVYGGGIDNSPINGDLLDSSGNATVVTINGEVTVNDVFGGGIDTSPVVKGNTFVTISPTGNVLAGSVYGGGNGVAGTPASHSSIQAGNTKVLIQGQVKTDVYGGGWIDSHVSGNTDVNIDTGSNVLSGDVYGGGRITSPINGTSGTVVLVDGTVTTGNVYGGGITNSEITNGSTNVTINTNGKVLAGSVYGGGINNSFVGNNTSVDLKQGSIVHVDVYGGGINTSPVNGTTGATVLVDGTVRIGTVYGGGITNSEITNGSTNVTINTNGKVLAGSVYGGGINNSFVGNNTSVDLKQGSIVHVDVYGGGINTSPVNGTTGATVRVDGTVRIGTVYGGGITNSEITNGSTNVTIDTHGLVNAGSVYGGGIDNSFVGNNTSVDLKQGSIVHVDVYGGGINASPVNGAGGTTVRMDGIVRTGSVYGGGVTNSPISNGNTLVTIDTSGRVNTGSVYGGGHGQGGASDISNGSTAVVINGYVKTDVFGGSILNSFVRNNAAVTVSNSGQVDRDVFGGGINGSDINGVVGTTVTINGYVGRNVFGGGTANSKIVANTNVSVNGAGSTGNPTADTGTVINNVHGGGWSNNSHIGGYTNVAINGTNNSQINANHVFGGGWDNSHVNGADLAGNGTTVRINAQSLIKGNVYGGGWNNSPVTVASALVELFRSAVVNTSVYGGGLLNSPIAEHTVVNIDGTLTTNPLENNVYGGGQDTSDIQGNGGTTVTLNANAQVSGNVFGGGRNNSHVLGANGTRVLLRTGANVGTAPDTYEMIKPSYASYPTYKKGNLSTAYPSTGNVYGGGTAGGSQSNTVTQASNIGLASRLDGQGTKVTIENGVHTSGVIYGGGFDSDIIAQDGQTQVVVKGNVGAVHGGGRQGSVSQANVKNGADVLVTDGAFVNYDVYGGGYGDMARNTEVRKTNVVINNGANVRERVFGGGHGAQANIAETTSIKIDGVATLIGHKEIHTPANTIRRVTGLKGNIPPKANTATDHEYFEFYNRYTNLYGDATTSPINNASFNTLGQIYGGGNNATVIGDIAIDINNNHRNQGQKVYDRISGGNLGTGLPSTNNRYIYLHGFGVGDYLTEYTNYETQYKPVEDYAVIRFLQDYTTATAEESYLTVYYNLMAYDDGEGLLGTDYTYNSKFTADKGIYHSWRPEPDTNVVIEPKLHIKNQSKFRIRGGYSVELASGLFVDDLYPTTVSLLIDLPTIQEVSTTTKIFSTANNVSEKNIFRYNELPNTLVPKDIIYQNNANIFGVNFYIPPRKIEKDDGQNTNSGGTTQVDTGTGSASGGHSGGSGGGVISGGFAGGGGGIAFAGPSSSVKYITSEKTVVDQEDINSRVTAAIKKAGAGKTAIVTETKAGQIAGDTLRSMSVAATKAGGTVTYYADTVRSPQFIEGRMYLDPAKAAGVKGVLNTGVYTHPNVTKKIQTIFAKYYKNKVVVVHLAHEGELGMQVRVAAKVDLAGLDTKTLIFYSYNAKTNAYTKIANPNYYIDQYGYVHFDTSMGGDVIITDQTLSKK